MGSEEMEEGSGRLFENNSPHDAEPGTGHRDQDPAKDATLEPESDDELFINETPALDDEDDDSYQDMSTSEFPREHFDDSSNFVDEEETTYTNRFDTMYLGTSSENQQDLVAHTQRQALAAVM